MPSRPKSEATRALILDKALALFRERGVEATTMRDIAKGAKLSLGAAYYYFETKDAIVFAYYEQNQLDMERFAATVTTGSARERVGALMHAKLDSIRDSRPLLVALLPRLVNPGDPLSALSVQTHAVRDRAVTLFADALRATTQLPHDTIALLASALWLFQLAAMLLHVNDATPREENTHRFVDEALDMFAMLLPFVATPAGRAIALRIRDVIPV